MKRKVDRSGVMRRAHVLFADGVLSWAASIKEAWREAKEPKVVGELQPLPKGKDGGKDGFTPIHEAVYRRWKEQEEARVLGEWIDGMEWTHFCTFTTGYQLTVKSARTKMEKYYQSMVRYYGNACCLYWVAERFQTKEGWHLHALVYVPPAKRVQVKHLKGLWAGLGGKAGPVKDSMGYKKRADVRKYKKGCKAGSYLVKDIPKVGSDWDLHGLPFAKVSGDDS